MQWQHCSSTQLQFWSRLHPKLVLVLLVEETTVCFFFPALNPAIWVQWTQRDIGLWAASSVQRGKESEPPDVFFFFFYCVNHFTKQQARRVSDRRCGLLYYCSVSWPQCPEVFLGTCNRSARTNLAKVTAQLLETLLFSVSFHKTSSFF